MEIAALICNKNLDYETVLQMYSIYNFNRKSGNQIQLVDYNLLEKNIKGIYQRSKNDMLYRFLSEKTILTARRYDNKSQLADNIPLADEYLIANADYDELNIFPKENCIVYGSREQDKGKILEIQDEYKEFSSIFEFKGTEIKRVADPIFLTTKDEWKEFGASSNMKDKGKYILIYAKIATKDMLEYARNMSRKNNAKVYLVADKVEILPLFYGVRKLTGVLPDELTYLVENAQDVITSCDEAIKLSVIFEKKVHIFVDDKNYENQMLLINEFNLLDRIVAATDRVIMKDEDFKEAREKIESLRENSKEIFK